MIMIIIGIILVLVSLMQVTGTAYSAGYAPGTLLIGAVLILLGLIY